MRDALLTHSYNNGHCPINHIKLVAVFEIGTMMVASEKNLEQSLLKLACIKLDRLCLECDRPNHPTHPSSARCHRRILLQ